MEWADRLHNFSLNRKEKPDVIRLEAGNRLSVNGTDERDQNEN
jgi:hypothetical protein